MTAAGGMPCPICRVPLVMSERQGVEIDYCPQCRGVWLDRGELDKIIARSAAELAPPSAPAAPHQPSGVWSTRPPQPYRPDLDGYARGRPPKRRKSFLEELFD